MPTIIIITFVLLRFRDSFANLCGLSNVNKNISVNCALARQAGPGRGGGFLEAGLSTRRQK